MSRDKGQAHRRALILATLIVLLTSVGLHDAGAAVQVPPERPGDPYVLAHYYIWYDATSWNRAKTDFPLLGRYSSDQASVMRRHIELAQSAGIDGFIVSWKSTEVLDPRLEQLVAIAEEMDFKLAITYQGLDFNRDPLTIDRVESDLDVFIQRYADSPVFDIFGKPLVVVTGTWELSGGDVQRITHSRRSDLLILATEKDVDGYRAIADYVDGNLYYWSSVNPFTNSNHAAKLAEMGNEIRAHGGLWIAPVAPGFDATEVGGTTVVERRDGETLREEWQAALDSIPDAIGIISWNEFSENTHIEPSENHGAAALETIAALTGMPKPVIGDFDSSAPEGRPASGPGRFLAVGLFLAIVATVPFLIRGRARAPRVPHPRDSLPWSDSTDRGSSP
jgi:hypothetical protein